MIEAGDAETRNARMMGDRDNEPAFNTRLRDRGIQMVTLSAADRAGPQSCAGSPSTDWRRIRQAAKPGTEGSGMPS